MAGLAIAAPVGPVNVLCASRTLAKGRASGVLSGLGAASADAFYGGIAAFSITLVIDFLRRELFWIRVVGGLLLVLIGVIYFRKPVRPIDRDRKEDTHHSDFTSTLFLTMTNPTTVLSFLAVLTALGLNGAHDWRLNFLVVGGIFAGSMAWWLLLVGIVDRLRDRFNGGAMTWMNRVAGIAIGLFGMFTFALGLLAPR